jgi:hypothetical protein
MSRPLMPPVFLLKISVAFDAANSACATSFKKKLNPNSQTLTYAYLRFTNPYLRLPTLTYALQTLTSDIFRLVPLSYSYLRFTNLWCTCPFLDPLARLSAHVRLSSSSASYRIIVSSFASSFISSSTRIESIVFHLYAFITV